MIPFRVVSLVLLLLSTLGLSGQKLHWQLEQVDVRSQYAGGEARFHPSVTISCNGKKKAKKHWLHLALRSAEDDLQWERLYPLNNTQGKAIVPCGQPVSSGSPEQLRDIIPWTPDKPYAYTLVVSVRDCKQRSSFESRHQVRFMAEIPSP